MNDLIRALRWVDLMNRMLTLRDSTACVYSWNALMARTVEIWSVNGNRKDDRRDDDHCGGPEQRDL